MVLNTKITKEDILQVAKSINMKEPSEKVIQEIIKEYPAEERNDPTATWDLVIENQLYKKLDEAESEEE